MAKSKHAEKKESLVGEPRAGKDFAGREALLQSLLRHGKKAGARRRHLALAAPRKCGRSSLLTAFSETTSAARGAHLISLNFNQRTLEDLIEHFLYGLALSAMSATARARKPDLVAAPFPECIAAFPKHLAGLGKEMLDIWERWTGRMNEIELLGRCLGLPDQFQKALRGTFWVVCDHFEGLVALTEDAFLAGPFRKALDRNRSVRWMLAGTPPSLMQRLTQGRNAPLGGLVELFAFRGLAYTEATRFLERFPAAKRLPTSHRSFLIALTGGHPYYLEILADGLEHSASSSGSRANPNQAILDTLTRELFAGAGRLNLYFNGLLGESMRGWRAPELYLGMIEAIARGQNTLVGICHAIRREAPALSRQVQNLLDSGLVAKEGTRYFIPDFLFGLWLRHVYLARRAPRPFGDTGLKQFQDRFRSLLAEFLENVEAETVRRVARILSASDGKAPLPGHGDEEDAPVLPRFDQVEVGQKLAEETFDLVARQANSYWLFAIFEELPVEGKVAEFAGRVERVRRASPPDHSVQAVVLALAGLPRVASKAAAHFKMEVWGREELNGLAECYGQLPVVG